jgi:tellurite methyltransferase
MPSDYRWQTGDEDTRAYFAATWERGPNPFVEKLAPFLPEAGHAIDLGAGVGNTSLWLVERGWTVDAFDVSPDAAALFAERLAGREGARFHLAGYADADLPACGAAIAVFSLFFERPDAFPAVWTKVTGAIKPGGLFAGQFLGPNDDWADGCTTHTEAEVDRLLAGWEVVLHEHEDRDGQTILGRPKHWDVHHIVARKP